MIETILIKKKKKQMASLIQEPVQEIRQTFVKRMKQVFRGHVGEEKSITAYDLFVKFYNVNPEDVEYFRRMFMWSGLKKLLRYMRTRKIAFVIDMKEKYFILQTQREANFYRGMNDSVKERLDKASDRADEWVQDKKWKDFL
jgi:hypothetical protein